MTDHPITPPPSELVLQWIGEHFDCTAGGELSDLERFLLSDLERFLTTRAAQYGADQELEACCEWLDGVGDLALQLRAARRPKPKSQAEKALASLDGVALPEEAWQAVSAALERLRELEKSND